MSDTKIEPLDVDLYKNLLERLVQQGECHGKEATVTAVQFIDFRTESLTRTGKSEAKIDIKVDPNYIVMDVNTYTDRESQQALIEKMLSNYKDDLFGNHPNEPHLIAAGAWIGKKSNFEDDYKQDPQNSNLFIPNPEAFRICVTTNEEIGLPTTWNPSFTVEVGGTIAIRSKDLPNLAAALKKIDNGEALAKDVLYNTDGTSKFDVYGMEPEFLEKNYAPTPTPQIAADTQAEYRKHLESRPEVKPDYWLNRDLGVGEKATELGIGQGTYATMPFSKGRISTTEDGIPAHANEKIIATTGYLNSQATHKSTNFTAREYALLSYEPESDTYAVRQFSFWDVGSLEARTPDLLHVTSEARYDTLKEAQQALSTIDDNLKNSSTPTIQKFVMPAVLQDLDRQIAGQAVQIEEKSALDKMLDTVFKRASSSNITDMIQHTLGERSTYSMNSFSHAGLTLTPVQANHNKTPSPELVT